MTSCGRRPRSFRTRRASSATGTAPAPHPTEKDGLLTRTLWTRVSSGATARECEADVRTDAYRIRRLLAHWLEQGALRIEAP